MARVSALYGNKILPVAAAHGSEVQQELLFDASASREMSSGGMVYRHSPDDLCLGAGDAQDGFVGDGEGHEAGGLALGGGEKSMHLLHTD